MTYAHGAVILSLTFHGCELFLKAAILQKVPTEQFSGNTGHNLEHLSKRYANLFPGKAWALDLPFRHHPPELDGLDPRIAEELKTIIREQQREGHDAEDGHPDHRFASDAVADRHARQRTALSAV